MNILSVINKAKNNRTLVNGTLFSAFSFANQGISFVLLILLASYISPSEYGKLSLFNTLVQFLGYFVALSTTGYMSISFFQRERAYFYKDFSAISVITIVCTGIVLLLIFFFKNTIIRLTDLPEYFIWIAIGVSFCSVFLSLYLDFLRIQEKVGKYGLMSCSFAILNFGVSLYLVAGMKLGWIGRPIAQIVCTFLYATLAISFFIQKGMFVKSFKWEDYKRIIYWSIPLIPHLAAVWLKQGGDRLIINYYHSPEDVGIFSFALNMMSIIIMIGTAFNATNSVSIYKTLASSQLPVEKKKSLNKQIKEIGIIYIVAYITVIILGVILVPILLEQYVSSIPYFLILSIAGLFQCFYFLYCNFLFYYHKNKILMYITFGTAVLHLCLSFALTRFSLYFTTTIYSIIQILIYLLIKNKSQKLLKETGL